jgi:CRISPR-associated endonuclease Cas1
MNSQETIDVKDSLDSVERTFGVDQHRGDVAVVDGYGLRVRVERGQLVLIDGLGESRRERRYAKATHGLSRIVVLGTSGTLSLDALRSCDRLGIALVVIDPADSRPLFASTVKGTNDARLLRVQAQASSIPVGMELTRKLLFAKLTGQARNAIAFFGDELVASSITDLAESLYDATSLDELRNIEAIAAAGYFHLWAGSPLAVPRFAKKDQKMIPDHWLRYDGRTSVLKGSRHNRRAERPVNALLNYLFTLVEVETVFACRRVGIDPSLGLLHTDQAGRDSMALDIMEPVRPAVEAWVLELLTKRTFLRSDFAEGPDGHVRLLPPLSHELAGTMGQWRRLVSPWAEKTLRLLGEEVKGQFVPSTPLTQEKNRRAQREVRARKARETLNRSVAGAEARVIQGPQESSTSLRTCVDCGGRLSREQHQRCPTCWESLPGQDIQTRRRRGAAISESKREGRVWREEHPLERGDPEEFRRSILPGLQGVPLSEIMRACGVAKSTASAIRSGKRAPAVRHWRALGLISVSKRVRTLN